MGRKHLIISLVMTSDVNIERMIPMNSVTAKPTTDAEPMTHSTIAPMMVVTLPSMIAAVERLKPTLIAEGMGLELCLYSSRILSKMTMLASTAIPIDSRMPDQRVRLISEVLNPVAAVTVTDADDAVLDKIGFHGFRLKYADVGSFDKDEALLRGTRSQMIDLDPVYSIFTSGSTGVPKGVVISHRGMIDLAEWLVGTFGFNEHDALGNQTPFYFDGSVKDICICLKSGATMHIVGKKYFTFPKLLIPFLNDRKITCILWATSAITLIGNSDILDVAVPQYLRIVTFAGEAMPAKQLKVWMGKLPERCRFINLYGPTEITVDCTYYEVDREFEDNEYIPIGKACRNKQIIVLNDSNQPVGTYEPGELCVRGTGVALGYYNNPQKTADVLDVVGLSSSLAVTTICSVYRGECGIGGCIVAIKDASTTKAKEYFRKRLIGWR